MNQALRARRKFEAACFAVWTGVGGGQLHWLIFLFVDPNLPEGWGPKH